jgi:hypothetical protein
MHIRESVGWQLAGCKHGPRRRVVRGSVRLGTSRSQAKVIRRATEAPDGGKGDASECRFRATSFARSQRVRAHIVGIAGDGDRPSTVACKRRTPNVDSNPQRILTLPAWVPIDQL